MGVGVGVLVRVRRGRLGRWVAWDLLLHFLLRVLRDRRLVLPRPLRDLLCLALVLVDRDLRRRWRLRLFRQWVLGRRRWDRRAVCFLRVAGSVRTVLQPGLPASGLGTAATPTPTTTTNTTTPLSPVLTTARATPTPTPTPTPAPPRTVIRRRRGRLRWLSGGGLRGRLRRIWRIILWGGIGIVGV